MRAEDAYQPDRSARGKIRRRLVRLQARRPAPRGLGAGAVSFSFDDPPVSATSEGAAILARHGARGTYFVSAGLLGSQGPMGPYADWADIERVAAQGHEVACHSYSHLDCGRADGPAADADIARNQAAFAEHGLPRPRTFAYPYGDVSHAAKLTLSARYGLLRALHHGLMSRGCDLSQAPSVGIEGLDGEAAARSWMRRAAASGDWLILYTHDVQADPSPWGCTPEAFERLVLEAEALGLERLTVAEGLERIAG